MTKARRACPCITVLTDYGLDNSYAAELKGRILCQHPTIPIIDITHEVPPGDIDFAAHVFGHAYEKFPRNTIHVIAVDPRLDYQPIIAISPNYLFIGSDSGVFSFPFMREKKISVLEITQKSIEKTETFRGRDLFASLVAELALGRKPITFGSPLPTKPRLLDNLDPIPLTRGGWEGRVTEIDRYGNILTNIRLDLFYSLRRPCLKIKGIKFQKTIQSFSQAMNGKLYLLENCYQEIEIILNQKSAAAFLDIQRGEKIFLFDENFRK